MEFSQHIFEKYSNIKFHENPSNGDRVVTCGGKDGEKTDMKNLIVAFRNSASKPKNSSYPILSVASFSLLCATRSF
jgi:hypothetical protein